ncbi:MAG: YciI family protein [Mycobacteriales bacterium]
MQYMVIGRDGKDPNAMLRRRAARDEHLASVARMREAGTLVCAAALLDDLGQMIGSMMLVSFPSRTELDAWLRVEPYLLSGVWQDVAIQPAQLAPAFAHLLPTA